MGRVRRGGQVLVVVIAALAFLDAALSLGLIIRGGAGTVVSLEGADEPLTLDAIIFLSGFEVVNPVLAVAGIVFWLAAVSAVTWAGVQLWSPRPLRTRRVLLVLLLALLFLFVAVAFNRESWVPPSYPWLIVAEGEPAVWIPGRLGATVLGGLTALFLVGLPLWAAVDASRWSDRAFAEAGRGGRYTWIVAPVLLVLVGLGWALAIGYFAAVRPRVATSARATRLPSHPRR